MKSTLEELEGETERAKPKVVWWHLRLELSCGHSRQYVGGKPKKGNAVYCTECGKVGRIERAFKKEKPSYDV